MKKNIFLTAMALLVSSATFAGGLLTNTNQNVAFLRNPARDAVIAIDGVYSNPAGVAFLPKGFHLSLNWQAAWQKREMISSAPFYGFNQNNKGITENGLTYNKYVGTASAPVIPSFQAAYVINDKWSVSAQFAIGGGGGKCEFDNGLPMFEQLVGGQMGSTIAGAVPYSYGFNQNLIGEQYFYGIQVGATYKIGKHVSVFAGARGIIAKSGYEGAISNITVNGNGASVYATQMNQAIAAAQQFAAAGDLANAQYYQTLATKAGTAAAMMSDYNLDCQQSGLGITPILGVDVNLGKLNTCLVAVSGRAITPELPVGASVLAVGGERVEVVKVDCVEDGAVISGVLSATAYLRDGDEKIFTVNLETPFESAVSCAYICEELSEICVRAYNGRAKIISLTETELEADINFTVYPEEKTELEIIGKIKPIGEKVKPTAGLSVYIATPGEDMWSLAKRLSVSPETLAQTNSDLTFPLTGDERIVIYRQN